jgi:hypothetical protein
VRAKLSEEYPGLQFVSEHWVVESIEAQKLIALGNTGKLEHKLNSCEGNYVWQHNIM